MSGLVITEETDTVTLIQLLTTPQSSTGTTTSKTWLSKTFQLLSTLSWKKLDMKIYRMLAIQKERLKCSLAHL